MCNDEGELVNYALWHRMDGILSDNMTITLGTEPTSGPASGPGLSPKPGLEPGPKIRSFLMKDSWINLKDGLIVEEFCWEECAKSLGMTLTAAKS